MRCRVTAVQLPARAARLRLKLLIAALLCAVPAVAAVSLAPAAQAAVPTLRQPAFAKSIEPMAAYVGQTSCEPGYRVGTWALGRLLSTTYRDTTFQGAYACGTDGSQSEHYDGRAVDWMASIRNANQHAEATAVIKFLLATDKYGNKFANARRMGVMYVIYDNKMWGSWDGQWEDYNNCAKTPSTALDSACHRNHMHISLSWSGALGRTSFWSASHAAYPVQDYGVCRPADLNWAADYKYIRLSPCPRYNVVAPPAHASMAKTWVVAYSGAVMFPGQTGQPVRAVQMAFNIPQTGRFDATTVAKVNQYRRLHRLPVNSIIDSSVWRLLLKTTP